MVLVSIKSTTVPRIVTCVLLSMDSGDDEVIISRVDVVDSIPSISDTTLTTFDIVSTMLARSFSASPLASFCDSSAETTTWVRTDATAERSLVICITSELEITLGIAAITDDATITDSSCDAATTWIIWNTSV